MDMNRLSPDPIHQIFRPPKETFMGQLSPIFSKVRIGGYLKEGVKVPIIAVGGIRSFSTQLLPLKKLRAPYRGSSNICSGT